MRMSSKKHAPVSRSAEKEWVRAQTGVQASTTGTSNAEAQTRKKCYMVPPYNKNIRSNVGKEFISLINRSFPTGHKLRKIFNRNTLKLSYSCMPNVKQLIDGHN